MKKFLFLTSVCIIASLFLNSCQTDCECNRLDNVYKIRLNGKVSPNLSIERLNGKRSAETDSNQVEISIPMATKLKIDPSSFNSWTSGNPTLDSMILDGFFTGVHFSNSTIIITVEEDTALIILEPDTGIDKDDEKDKGKDDDK